MAPYLSIIVPTMRVGGLDCLFDSLAKQSFSDFEIVLIDGLKRHRAERVAREAHDRFLKVVHVEPHPNPWPLTSFCSYSNAGLVAASGEVALFLVDYSVLPPGLLAAHAAAHRADATGKLGFMGPHTYCHLNVALEFPRYAGSDVNRYEEDVRSGKLDDFMWSTGYANVAQAAAPHVVDGGVTATHDADPKLRHAHGPITPSYFHAKNESVRLEHCLAINGWDEDLDGSHGWQDTDFAERLSHHAGVQWMLGAPVVDIANPRGVFPFARRTREFGTNEKIWQSKRAAGYPPPNRWNLRDRRTATACVPKGHLIDGKILPELSMPEIPEAFGSTAMGDDDVLSIAMIYGEFSSAIHGPFNIPGLYKTQGLTGSESSFFNLARTLAERGHRVVVFCVCDEPVDHESGFTAMPIRALGALRTMTDLDAVIAWNEPDYLRFAPPGVVRIVDQQLNDWGYCQQSPLENTDLFVFPSKSSLDNHGPQLAAKFKASIIPNSVALDLFQAAIASVERNPHRVVYCSSPDRGLHHLLSFWPEIRAQVPDAELKIFYRITPWLQGNLLNPNNVGQRARFVEAALERMKDGFGIEVVGPVPNERMARELQSAAVLAYPCDPVRYTEGFGCSVLDATAAGCLPIISDVDALAEVHGPATHVLTGKPSKSAWVSAILKHLLAPPENTQHAFMSAHASAHSREKITDQWETLIRASVKAAQ